MLEQSGIILLEPIMKLEVVMPEEYSSRVMGDLGKRRAQIQEVTVRGQYKVIIIELFFINIANKLES